MSVLLLGNKSDCEKREVKTQQGVILAKVSGRGVTSSNKSITTSVKSMSSSNALAKGNSFTSTGVQLYVHGVQRCHGGKCDSVVGNCGQVTHFPCVADAILPAHSLCSFMFFMLADSVFGRMLSQKVDTREETMALHKEPQQKKSGCC